MNWLSYVAIAALGIIIPLALWCVAETMFPMNH